MIQRELSVNNSFKCFGSEVKEQRNIGFYDTFLARDIIRR